MSTIQEPNQLVACRAVLCSIKDGAAGHFADVYEQLQGAFMGLKGTIAACLLTLLSSNASALDVTMSVKSDGNEKPIITGLTNLPDETELIVGVHSVGGEFFAQSEARVESGQFSAGKFSTGDSALPPGLYTVEVSAGMSAIQPDSVQTVFGKEGRNLKGRYVKTLGIGGAIVDFSTKMKLP